jgi:hypothetical protein
MIVDVTPRHWNEMHRAHPTGAMFKAPLGAGAIAIAVMQDPLVVELKIAPLELVATLVDDATPAEVEALRERANHAARLYAACSDPACASGDAIRHNPWTTTIPAEVVAAPAST